MATKLKKLTRKQKNAQDKLFFGKIITKKMKENYKNYV